MKLEFLTKGNFNIVEALAEKIGVIADNNCIEWKSDMGNGFIKLMELGPAFQIILNRFWLKEEFIIKRRPVDESRNLLTVSFYLHDKPVVFLKDRDANSKYGINCPLFM